MFKDTQKEKLHFKDTKSMNMDIWVVGTSNELFIRSS